jgi:hypothetical protein
MDLDKQTDRDMKNPREEAQALVDKIIKVIDNNVHNDVSGLILKQHWHQVREELKLL